MESQPQNPEFRNNPENFYPCFQCSSVLLVFTLTFNAKASSMN